MAVERLLREAGYMTQAYRSAPEFLAATFPLRREGSATPGLLRERLERLTPRETEVFTRVVLGLPNKQVAHELGTGEQVIKFHRANVMAKMGAGSFAELVRMAEWLGINGSAEFSVQSSACGAECGANAGRGANGHYTKV